MKHSYRILIIAVLVFLAGCPAPPAVPTTHVDDLKIFAGVPPVAALVREIVGDEVEVGLLITDGNDPHTYDPTPRQIMELSSATLYFGVGLPFETRLLEKIKAHNPRMVIIETDRNIEKRLMLDGHEHAGESSVDPHVWLVPNQVKIMAENICAALILADPEHASSYQENSMLIRKRIDMAEHRIQQTLEPYFGRTFFVFH